ncbi:MAG: NlpC/P60 family protein [Jatrophihabitans sp.]|nr:MAG: NlpC/P60 family protein [Jatrophihabitans sp.]
MARANRRRIRRLALVSSVAAIAALTPVLGQSATADPPPGQPTVAQIQRQLGELAFANTQLVEQYDVAQGDVAVKTQAAQQAEQLAAQADSAFQIARDQLGAAAAAIYEGGSFSATGALLTSSSGQSYLDRLQTLSMISSHTAQVVDNLNIANTQAQKARKQADGLLASAQRTRDALAAKKAEVEKQLGDYQALLDRLGAQQRAAYLQQVNPAVSAATVAQLRAQAPSASSGAAATAVQFALAQVGKPYVFGAAGPNSYDCSGLTMAAWAAAGVSLPHSAAGQYGYGTHVSFAQLQPGDLMFFYQPIGHVTIYIGNGMMVSAPTSGQNVSVVPANQFGSAYVGATRLTG